MIESVINLVSYGFYGGEIGNLLAKLEQFGFFSYFLPFLLLFALIFGILTRTKVFGKEINGIIALVVGLMALQFDFVPRFFAEIFPRLGVGLAVILVVIILLGLFAPHTNASWMTYAFLAIGVIILAIVLVQTAGGLGWSAGYWWYDNWGWIVGIIVFLIIIGTIVGASSETKEQPISIITADLRKT